jgi:hypothetical protein
MINRRLIDLVLADQKKRLAEDVRLRREGCLTLARARAVCLDPERLEGPEQKHLASCHDCQRLQQRLKEAIPHPTLWHLLRSLLRGLSEQELRTFPGHMSLDRCEQCRRRLGLLEAKAQQVVRLLLPMPPPQPAGVSGIALPGNSVRAASPDARWDAEYVPGERESTVKVCCREGGSSVGLAALVLDAGDGADLPMGLIPLQYGLSGEVAVSPGLLYGAGEGPTNLIVWPVDLACLTAADADSLSDWLRAGSRWDWRRWRDAALAEYRDRALPGEAKRFLDKLGR